LLAARDAPESVFDSSSLCCYSSTVYSMTESLLESLLELDSLLERINKGLLESLQKRIPEAQILEKAALRTTKLWEDNSTLWEDIQFSKTMNMWKLELKASESLWKVWF